jgi:hypothetical protein
VLSVEVEKRKWDGTLSSAELAYLVPGPADVLGWYVPRGTQRRRPGKGATEALPRDEIWVTRPGEWWVLCGYGRADGSISEFDLHAAVPPEMPEAGVLRWIDLDLDLELRGDDVDLADEAQFHEHALTMDYPDHVIRGAWTGISTVAPRRTTGEWPFDGWMERCLRAARASGAGRGG